MWKGVSKQSRAVRVKNLRSHAHLLTSPTNVSQCRLTCLKTIENHTNSAVLWFLNTDNNRVRSYLFLLIVYLHIILEARGGFRATGNPPAYAPDYCYNFLKLKVHVQVYGLLRIVLISTEICVGNFNSSSKFCYST